MKIFVVNGQGGCGKDSFVKFIMDAASDDEIIKTSIIDPVKELAEQIGWRDGKTEKDRKFLCDLKNLLDDYNNYCFEKLIDFVYYVKDYLNTKAIFIDAREKQDIEKIKLLKDVKTILITRGDKKIYGNPADDNVFDYSYNFIIKNDGSLEELKEIAENFYEALILENNDAAATNGGIQNDND